MEWQEKICHGFYFKHGVIGFIAVDIGAWWNHLHFHGFNLDRRVKIFFDYAKSGNGCPALFGLDKDSHSTWGVDGGVHQINTRYNFQIVLDDFNLFSLFYFIDEIFRGTNNRERLLGSGAYIQALAGKPGVGLIATHDLELVQLADELPAIENFHFTDEIVDSRMYFDYTLRTGPSPTTNALKIMQMEGLPIP